MNFQNNLRKQLPAIKNTNVLKLPYFIIPHSSMKYLGHGYSQSLLAVMMSMTTATQMGCIVRK
jgi:hypothetical protein